MSGWMIAAFVAWIIGCLLMHASQRNGSSGSKLVWGLAFVLCSYGLSDAHDKVRERERIESRLDALERAAPRVGSR